MMTVITGRADRDKPSETPPGEIFTATLSHSDRFTAAAAFSIAAIQFMQADLGHLATLASAKPNAAVGTRTERADRSKSAELLAGYVFGGGCDSLTPTQGWHRYRRPAVVVGF